MVEVDKCTDPLQVNITVKDDQAVVIMESTVTSASDLQDTDYAIDTFTRDDQAFTISVCLNSIVFMSACFQCSYWSGAQEKIYCCFA